MTDHSVASQPWSALKQWVSVADGSMADLCLFLEEAGAVLLPGPFFATTSLFMPLLRSISSSAGGDIAGGGSTSSDGSAQVADLLAEASAGKLTGTVALAGADSRWEVNDGPIKSFVPEAERVDLIALVSGGANSASVTLFRSEDVAIRPVGTIDPSRRLAEVDASGAAPILEPMGIGANIVDDLLARGCTALSAELMGTTRWLLDTTITYASNRRQFGKPIGSFQAIKHKLADVALLHEQAWSSVYYAAMCIDANDPARRRSAHVAKVMASHAAIRCAKEAIQIHGGVGYTWEHDLHLYLRRAFATEDILGTSDWHLDRLADDLM
jgi:alkylation response protein AidB-like acyl-CoA dehydrogenase